MEKPHLIVGGAQDGFPPFKYPLSYHSGWEGDLEKDSKAPEVAVRSAKLRTRCRSYY